MTEVAVVVFVALLAGVLAFMGALGIIIAATVCLEAAGECCAQSQRGSAAGFFAVGMGLMVVGGIGVAELVLVIFR